MFGFMGGVCVPDYVREVASQIGSNMHRPSYKSVLERWPDRVKHVAIISGRQHRVWPLCQEGVHT